VRYLRGNDDEAGVVDENWTLHPPVAGSLPGTVCLATRQHVDSFSDLPAPVAADFGRVAADAACLGGVLPKVPDEALRAAAERVGAAMSECSAGPSHARAGTAPGPAV
jgi:hypothetical protein